MIEVPEASHSRFFLVNKGKSAVEVHLPWLAVVRSGAIQVADMRGAFQWAEVRGLSEPLRTPSQDIRTEYSVTCQQREWKTVVNDAAKKRRRKRNFCHHHVTVSNVLTPS